MVIYELYGLYNVKYRVTVLFIEVRKIIRAFTRTMIFIHVEIKFVPNINTFEINVNNYIILYF